MLADIISQCHVSAAEIFIWLILLEWEVYGGGGAVVAKQGRSVPGRHQTNRDQLAGAKHRESKARRKAYDALVGVLNTNVANMIAINNVIGSRSTFVSVQIMLRFK